MDPARDEVLRRDALRLALLRKLYDASGGNERMVVALDDLASGLGLEGREAREIFDYLRGEGLIQAMGFGPMISLTHWGTVEVEATIRDPDRGSEHFSPPVIRQTIIIADHSAIAVDSPGVRQTIGAVNIDEFRDVLEALRSIAAEINLSETDGETLEADLATVEAQLRSPRPNGRIIRVALASGQRILEAAAGGAAGPGLAEIVERLGHLVGQLPL